MSLETATSIEELVRELCTLTGLECRVKPAEWSDKYYTRPGYTIFHIEGVPSAEALRKMGHYGGLPSGSSSFFDRHIFRSRGDKVGYYNVTLRNPDNVELWDLAKTLRPMSHRQRLVALKRYTDAAGVVYNANYLRYF